MQSSIDCFLCLLARLLTTYSKYLSIGLFTWLLQRQISMFVLTENIQLKFICSRRRHAESYEEVHTDHAPLQLHRSLNWTHALCGVHNGWKNDAQNTSCVHTVYSVNLKRLWPFFLSIFSQWTKWWRHKKRTQTDYYHWIKRWSGRPASAFVTSDIHFGWILKQNHIAAPAKTLSIQVFCTVLNLKHTWKGVGWEMRCSRSIWIKNERTKTKRKLLDLISKSTFTTLNTGKVHFDKASCDHRMYVKPNGNAQKHIFYLSKIICHGGS